MCSIIGVGGRLLRFWGRLDQNSGFHGNRMPPLTYIGEKEVSTFTRLFFIRSVFTLDSGERSLPFGLLVSHIAVSGYSHNNSQTFIHENIKHN